MSDTDAEIERGEFRGMAADRVSTALSLAALDEPSAAESLLSSLFGDPLRAVARLVVADDDRFCLRLACKTTRDHCERPVSSAISRAAFLRTRSLTVYACEELPDFVLADKMRMLALASRVGCVAVLAELMDVRGCDAVPLDSVDACRAAASRGQLEALMWLRGRGFEWDRAVCASAARGGHLEVLRYAHEQGCPWDSWTCSHAAGGGHLEALRYAHEHGCPWDSGTCYHAADEGHLETLRYAHEHGCPWNSGTCWSAAAGGHLEALRYAHERGCPWDWRWEPSTPYPPCISAYVETLRLAAQQPAPLAH